MNQKQLNYTRNIILSFYGVVTALGTGLFFYFLLMFFLPFWGITEPPKEEQKPSGSPEKRYTVNLQREHEPLPKRLAENINQNKKVPAKPKFLGAENAQSASPFKSENQSGDIKLDKVSQVDELSLKKGDKGNAEKGEDEKMEEKASKKEHVTSILDPKKSIESSFGKPVEDKKQSQKKGDNSNFSGSSFRNNLSSSAKANGAEILQTNISLSTYKWNWYPYIEQMKEKIYQFWSVPPAYHLGLLSGATQIKVVISRNGKMRFYKMLQHQGSGILQQSSEDVMLAIFDLPNLPPDFPDQELGITITLVYPRLR